MTKHSPEALVLISSGSFQGGFPASGVVSSGTNLGVPRFLFLPAKRQTSLEYHLCIFHLFFLSSS